jgi:hypothetical protein
MRCLAGVKANGHSLRSPCRNPNRECCEPCLDAHGVGFGERQNKTRRAPRQAIFTAYRLTEMHNLGQGLFFHITIFR